VDDVGVTTQRHDNCCFVTQISVCLADPVGISSTCIPPTSAISLATPLKHLCRRLASADAVVTQAGVLDIDRIEQVAHVDHHRAPPAARNATSSKSHDLVPLFLHDQNVPAV